MKRSALGLIALAMLWGCTTEAPQPAPKPQPPDLLTGRSAFQQLYVAARGWAGDIRGYRQPSRALPHIAAEMRCGRSGGRAVEASEPVVELQWCIPTASRVQSNPMRIFSFTPPEFAANLLRLL